VFPTRMPPLVLALLGALCAGVGVFLIEHDPREIIGWLVALFFGACSLVGVVGIVERSRERRRERGEHVPDGDPSRWLMIVAFFAGAIACGGIAVAVATGALPPDRQWGKLIVPVGAAAAVVLFAAAVIALTRRR
jgi:uncharacterized membrane protein YfcA